MRKLLQQIIEIPDGVEVKIDEGNVTVKGGEGEVKKKVNLGKLNFEVKDKKIIIGYEKSTKREKKMMNTIASHLRNMIKGAQKKFEYVVKICFSHFPMTVQVEDGTATIKNFLGEKVPRKVRIPAGVEVKIEKEIIKIISNDKELAGQTAASFETATKIRGRDRRVFQDGIFIINKAGKEI